MNNNIPITNVDLCSTVQSLVEQDQTPLLCVYYDKESHQVKVVGDSESRRKLGASKVMTELHNIVRNTHDGKKKLQYSGHESAAIKSCTEFNLWCLDPEPKDQMNLENKVGCYLGVKDDKLEVDWEELPSEMLRKIFDYLEPKDIRNILLVSHTWKSVAEEPSLWTWFNLPDQCYKNEEMFFKFFEGSLPLKLQYLVLNRHFEFQLNDEHFAKLLDFNLKFLRIFDYDLDLTNVSGDALAQLVNKCKKCELSGMNLEPDKLESVFTAMKTSSKLKSLVLRSVKLDDVPLDILSDALDKLNTLVLSEVELSQPKFRSLLESLPSKTEVTVHHTFKPDWDNYVLDAALSKLSGLRFSGGNGVENGQLIKWFEMLDKTCKLNFLGLSNFDLTSVPHKLLARVLNKIESLELCEMEVSCQQAEEIFLAMSTNDSLVKHFSMYEVKISSVCCEVFAKAVNRLESVDLGSCEDLSEDQLLEMFRVMSLGTNLKLLGSPEGHWNLTAIDQIKNIEKVDPQVLAKAVNNLEEAHFYFGGSENYEQGEKCYITLAQIIAFFKELNKKTSLRTIIRPTVESDLIDWEVFDL